MADKFVELESQFKSIFGEWHIVREIGRGSYGSVYEIQRESGGVTDKAALKHVSFPKDQYDLQSICSEIGTSDESVVRDFIYQSVQEYRGEYQIMREMKGMTNIVSCEDFQVVEKTDMPGYDIFIRMELLETVSSIMQREKLSREEVIRLGTDICSALELLEKKQILHRDIKPENIFRNQFGNYKLGDFGSARTMSAARAVVTAKGTPAYMAPEILLLKEAGPYTDIYSLGLVMYRLTNENRSPFLDADLASTTMTREAAASRRVTGERLPKPVNADEDLARVILKACEFRPEDRYQTAKAMRQDLEGLLKEKKEEPEKEEPKTAGKKDRHAEAQNRISREGTHLGRKNVLSQEEIDAINKAEMERIRKEKEAEEKAAAEAKRLAEEKKKKTIIAVVSTIVALVVLAVSGYLIFQAMQKKAAYNAAVAMLESDDLEGAQAALAEFEDEYEDAKDRKDTTKSKLDTRDQNFKTAKSTIEKRNASNEELKEAIDSLKGIKKQYPPEKQGDIDELIKQAEKKQAINNAEELAETDPEAGAEALNKLEQTDRASEILNNKQFQEALSALEDDAKIQEGIDLLNDLIEKGYRTDQCELEIRAGNARLEYLSAVTDMTAKNYEDAAEKFASVAALEEDFAGTHAQSVADAADRAMEAKARDLIAKEEYDSARKALNDYFIAKEEYDSARKALGDYESTEDPVLSELLQTATANAKNVEDFVKAQGDMKSAAQNVGYAKKQGFQKEVANNQSDYLEIAQGLYRDAYSSFTSDRLKDFSYRSVKASDLANQCEDWINYLKGLIQWRNHDYQAAQNFLQPLAEKPFEDADEQLRNVQRAEALENAENALKEYQYSKAQEEFLKLAELDPDAMKDGLEKVKDGEAKEKDYNKAAALMKEKKYEDAEKLLEGIAGYRPEADQLLETAKTKIKQKAQYAIAQEYENSALYQKAKDIYDTIKDYEDAEHRAKVCEWHVHYDTAREQIENGQLGEAEKTLKTLTVDADPELTEIAEKQLENIKNYREASAWLNNGDGASEDIEKALEYFTSLGQFYDAEELKAVCDQELKYRKATEKINSEQAEDIEEAEELFQELAGFGDDGYRDAKTRYAVILAEKYLERDEFDLAAGELNKFGVNSQDKAVIDIKKRISSGQTQESAFASAKDEMVKAANEYKQYIKEEKDNQSSVSGNSLIGKTDYLTTAKNSYETARLAFEKLGSFTLKGTAASDLAKECENWENYLQGLIYMRGAYGTAIKTFETLLKVPDLQEELKELAEEQLKEANRLALLEKAEGALDGKDSEAAQRYYDQLLMDGYEDDYKEGLQKVYAVQEQNNLFNQGKDAMNSEDYDIAISNFKRLADAKDPYPQAEEYLAKAQELNSYKQSYKKAEELEQNKDYQKALDIYQGLAEAEEPYKDSVRRAEVCEWHLRFAEAKRYIESGYLDNAETILNGLTKDAELGYLATEQIGYIASYRNAVFMQDTLNFQGAKDAFEILKGIGFYDAAVRYEECNRELQYRNAVNIMNDNPEAAADIFKSLGSFRDSQTYLSSCNQAIQYKTAKKAMDEGNYEGAYSIFSNLGNYSDSSTLANECNKFIRYDNAVSYMNQGNYDEANTLFVELGGFKDSRDRARKCQLESFIKEVSGGGDIYSLTRKAYEFIFSQDIEYSNRKNWAKLIPTNNPTGAELALGFADCPQFRAMNISDAQRIQYLCDVLLNGDTSNAALFEEYMSNGVSVRFILSKLIEQEIFKIQCKSDGILVGEIELTEARDLDYDTTRFVAHCFRNVLHWPASEEDMNLHTNMILNKEITLEGLMLQFLNTQEYKDKGQDNKEYVQTLYHLMFNRYASEADLNHYDYLLGSGMSRDELAVELCYNDECQAFLVQFRPYVLEYQPEESLEDFIRKHSLGGYVSIFARNTYEAIYSFPEVKAEDKERWAASLNIYGSISELLTSFVKDPAYSSETISNEDRVKALYWIMLNRRVDLAADPGSASFKDALDIGMSSLYVIKAIAGSAEFTNLADSQGMKLGEFNENDIQARDLNYNMTALVDRCYREGLGRPNSASPDEFNYWCGQVLNNHMTLQTMLSAVLTSDESRNYLQNDEDFITALYRIALDRRPDDGGMKVMLGLLQESGREAVINAITSSEEFINRWTPTGLPL